MQPANRPQSVRELHPASFGHLNAAPAKGVIRLQKGHVIRAVPILTVVILAIGIVATTGSTQRNTNRAVGPLIPLNGAGILSNDPSARPVIGHTLPTPPIMMGTRQGSGPNPDSNLTPTGRASIECDPHASPGEAQNRIVFASNGVDLDGNRQIDPTLPDDPDFEPNFNIWVMRSDGADQYQITQLAGDQREPAYDPGGRLVAFASNHGGANWQIYTVEVASGVIRQITTGPGNKRSPTWSPDSNWIAFSSDAAGGSHIYKVSAIGAGNPIQLTSGAGVDTDPSWSPGAMNIAFTRQMGGMTRIFQIDQDGGNLTALTNGGGDPQAVDKQPAWDATGASVIFSSSRLTEPQDTVRNFNIWRMASIGETEGAEALLVSSTDRTATSDNTNPTKTVDMASVPSRIVFESTRSADFPGDIDLWTTTLTDNIPPMLGELPSVDNRNPAPGAPITISVPVSDPETGVQSVVAIFKDPDLKTYLISPGSPFESSTFTSGVRYLEYDCEIIDTLVLNDDGQDGDQTALDGVFTGIWTTNAQPRDYIIDIQVTDNAGNSIVYDNIYGFSTKTFAPHNNILFVNDYCHGQLFPALLGWNNNFAKAWPVESYYTYNPGFHPGTEGTIDYDSISGAYGDGYDVWRIICRGPVPPGVYQYYLPTIEMQLDPAELNGANEDLAADREVLVADRAIVWAAPHTGNVWIADGSVMDASTQTDLANFVNRGGRLFMSGEDIAWALTLNGTVPNTFLSDTLRARFVQDSAFTNVTVNAFFYGRSWSMQRTAAGFVIGGSAQDPVSGDPWVGSGAHFADRPGDNWFDTDDNPTNMNTPTGTGSIYTDAAQFSFRPDAIEATTSTKIYGLGAAGSSPSFGGTTGGVRYEDPVTGGRVVFLSFGFEQIHRGYHAPSNLPQHSKNHRSHLMHNALCWMRTGGFQGRVISISDGGKPINDPAPIIRAVTGGQVRYAVRCQPDGSYMIQGLPPGYYTLEAARPGFEIDHFEGEFVHGGQTPRVVDFAIKRAQPGAVSGTVTAQGTDTPLGNVEVCLYELPPVPDEDEDEIIPAQFNGNGDEVELGPKIKCTRTAADGTYTLPQVTAGEYIVVADGSDIGYGSDQADVQTTPGSTTFVDFVLGAADGTVIATVIGRKADGSEERLANALVRLLDASDLAVANGRTDSEGITRIDVAPGVYKVAVEAGGFLEVTPPNVTVEAAKEAAVTVRLEPQPPGSIVGRVTSATTGQFVAGVLIRVKSGDVIIGTATTSATAVNPGAAVEFNYRVPDVPTGQVTVEASATGFAASPSSRSVRVESETEARDVNFTLSSLHTFASGLQLVSFPWDYSNVDPATILGLDTSDLRMATWETSRQRYRVYPDAPADAFRLGTGYWMRLGQRTDLTREGAKATDPFEIALRTGWNLIGVPYRSQLDFYSTTIRDTSGVTYTIQQALGNGLLGSGLFAYVLGGYQNVGAMTPYTGYWLKAERDCILIISETVSALSADTRPPQAYIAPEADWLLQLRTIAGEAIDSAAFIGQAASATSGFDAGLDQGKPPAPAMGPFVYTSLAGGENNDVLSVDIRPRSLDLTWNLKVQTNMMGQTVTLDWPDMSNLPNNLRPVLKDTDTGECIYMRTANAYSFVARAPEKNLQIVMQDDESGLLAIMPTGASNAGGGVAISYTLSKTASVEVRITNIAGRTISRLTGGTLQTSGVNTVVWNGRSDSGAPVPAGRYLATVIARTQEGQEARAVMPLQVNR